MLGAIIGDIIGSRWEFNPTNDYNFELFSELNSFTDDTICTIAIADAILQNRDFGESLHDWCNRYPHPMGGYGGRFSEWVTSRNPQPYNSFGNGSAMRVSPVAMFFPMSDEMLDIAARTAACTHNHRMGIKGAQAIAYCIRRAIDEFDGIVTKHKIRKMLPIICEEAATKFEFPSQICLEEHRNVFDETCQGTVPVALQIVKESNSFEDAIRRAVSLGADADTLGAIVGSIAEHVWGIPQWIQEKAKTYLPKEMTDAIDDFYKYSYEHDDFRPKNKEYEQQEALMAWKLSYQSVDINRFLRGQGPAPEQTQTATKDMIKALPIEPELVTYIDVHIELDRSQTNRLCRGHIPQAQEDHWFMYSEEYSEGEMIHYYRSMTGMLAFEAYYATNWGTKDGNYLITKLRVNKALCQFGVNGDKPAECLFRYLLKMDMDGEADAEWEEFLKERRKQAVINREEYEIEIEQAEERRSTVSNAMSIEMVELMDFMSGEQKRITPEKINFLRTFEVIVFGSDAKGLHNGGMARIAEKKFGAEKGVSEGLTGQSYAIVSTEGLTVLAHGVNKFIKFALENPDKDFYVTAIGCGKAGYTPEIIAPLFRPAMILKNVYLPREFWEYYQTTILSTDPQA